MYMVVTECYESLKYILEILVVGDLERRLYRLYYFKCNLILIPILRTTLSAFLLYFRVPIHGMVVHFSGSFLVY